MRGAFSANARSIATQYHRHHRSTSLARFRSRSQIQRVYDPCHDRLPEMREAVGRYENEILGIVGVAGAFSFCCNSPHSDSTLLTATGTVDTCRRIPECSRRLWESPKCATSVKNRSATCWASRVPRSTAGLRTIPIFHECTSATESGTLKCRWLLRDVANLHEPLVRRKAAEAPGRGGSPEGSYGHSCPHLLLGEPARA